MHSDIIIIADPHLGNNSEDVFRMISFIQTIDPSASKIVFLGDLFHIWAGPKRYHSEFVHQLLNELKRFQQNGGEAYLVVGNRDVLFRKFEKTPQYLPFIKIANDFLSLTLGQKHVVFNHGDLVNFNDHKYLKWRAFVRHPLFEFTMNHLPVKWANQILQSGEKNLKRTNRSFKQEFPAKEWSSFIESTYQKYQNDYLLIGHFHPKETIQTSHGKSIGIVVPAWFNHNTYGKLNKKGVFKLENYLPT